MDTGKNDLLISALCQFPGLSLHIPDLPAPDPSPGIGNDTVTAELIAAVLDFQKGPGMLACSFQMEFFILLLSVIDVNAAVLDTMLLLIFADQSEQILFAVISDQNIDSVVLAAFSPDVWT